MVRGIIVPITAVLAFWILKKKQYSHHLFSLFLILIGEVLVGIAAITMSGNSDESTIFEGMIMLLIAKVFTGFHFIVEEKLFEKYILHPLKVVGLEGMFGCTFFAILLPIF
jgi:hypothetical protein